jgi:hypothetical protein
MKYLKKSVKIVNNLKRIQVIDMKKIKKQIWYIYIYYIRMNK